MSFDRPNKWHGEFRCLWERDEVSSPGFRAAGGYIKNVNSVTESVWATLLRRNAVLGFAALTRGKSS